MIRNRLSPRRLFVLLLILTLILPLGLVQRPAQAQAPTPVLYSPMNGALTTAQFYSYPPTGTPTFEWLPVTAALEYNFQICPSAGCATQELSVNTVATRYTPLYALADGIWYWRVRARDVSGWGNYSSTWMFTKSWLDYGALKPQLLAPDDGATVEFFEYPIFSWTPVIGAAYYTFEIATDPAFSTVVYSNGSLKPTHTPLTRRARGLYYWRVTPVDRQGNQGSPSDIRQFNMDYLQTPTLLEPDDGSTFYFTPEFRWTAVKGAKEYVFQVSTDPNFTPPLYESRTTRNTRYTPSTTYVSDQEYYWRVAAVDWTGTQGPYSEAGNYRSFEVRWHLLPSLLTPTDNYIHAPFPVLSWTPVAGAKTYRLEVDNEPSFGGAASWTVKNPRYALNMSFTEGMTYYWRVQSQAGSATTPYSQIRAFQYSEDPAPTLIYPPYYYNAETISATQLLGVRTDPTVAAPAFMWDRVVHDQGGTNEVAADHYTVEVAETPLFTATVWATTTKNLSAAPSVGNPFDLTPGKEYYWRVQAFSSGGSPMGSYSEVWKTRIDPALQEYAATIAPYFPRDGMDNVYDTPLFGWSPVQGAARYRFEIDDSADFTTPEYVFYPTYAFYTPDTRLAPDTYYWRVKAQDAGGGDIGGWSDTSRVVITYPLRRDYDAYLNLNHPIMYGNGDHTIVGLDGTLDVPAVYDLTGLYLALDNTYWYLSLDMPVTNTTDMYFAFYVDLDHEEGSGGTTDPAGFNVQADPINLPEVALYAHHDSSGQVTSVKLYEWDNGWEPEQDLIGIGGDYDYLRGWFLELLIPLNIFDQGETWLGTVSIEAFTVDSGVGNQPRDTVPSEPSDPTSQLTNFTAVADKLNPLHPWDNPFSNPFVERRNPPLSFSKPLFRSYVQGYRLQVARDYDFTNVIISVEWASGNPPEYWFLSSRWTWQETFEDNNTLYWRLRMRHGAVYGPWSQPVRFTKDNYIPDNMTVEYDYAMPTFRWSRVEGASSYRIELSADPAFGSLEWARTTDHPSYTHDGSLSDGTWYWRLLVYDGNNRPSDYTSAMTFTKASRAPTLTTPIGGAVVNELPTFQWETLLYPVAEPVVGPSRYRLELDEDPNFSSPMSWDNMNSTCMTPDATVGKIVDSTYFWRVAARDSGGNLGPYSEVGVFYKAYLTPTLITATFEPVPDLTWEPLDGAAYYEVQLCRDSSYADCQTFVTVQTNYIHTAPVTDRRYWRVRMCDHKAACGPYYEDQVALQFVFLPVVFK